MPAEPPPVIAIDGPAASGKGAAARGVAERLGFHCLDSGSLYRAVALHSLREGVADADRIVEALAAAGEEHWGRLLADPSLRSEEVSERASATSSEPAVRRFLLERQRRRRRPPGLVAEGRDMGTVVFPDARIKVFLTASPEVRAARRRAELGESPENAKISAVLANLIERDERDSSRREAPLARADGAMVLDNSDIDSAATADLICEWFRQSAGAGRAGRGDGNTIHDEDMKPAHGS